MVSRRVPTPRPLAVPAELEIFPVQVLHTLRIASWAIIGTIGVSGGDPSVPVLGELVGGMHKAVP